MSRLKVTLLRNFIEDKRTSMELYADNLSSKLYEDNQRLDFQTYRPRVRYWKPGDNDLWPMRLARYFDYPQQVSSLQSDIFHIAEHGYAHLIRKFPREKTVVTVHDLIPLLRYKGLIRGVEPEGRPFLSVYSLGFLKLAGHIITVSQNTKADLIQHCQCLSKNISVINPGLPRPDKDRFSKMESRKKLGLPNYPTKLVLITGQNFYKNLESSIKIYNNLVKTHKDISLVHLGRKNQIWNESKAKMAPSGSLYDFSMLSQVDIGHLYTAVDCVLFPSWYEGFGLPPLEAMVWGTPAVTSNVASLPEVIGPDSLNSNPDDIEGLSSQVESILFDAEVREFQIQQGLKHADKFTWENCAKETAKVYRLVQDKQTS